MTEPTRDNLTEALFAPVAAEETIVDAEVEPSESDSDEATERKDNANRQRRSRGGRNRTRSRRPDSDTPLDETDETVFRKVNPYDTTYYAAPDSSGEIEIWYPRKMSITYKKKFPESEYLKKMKLPKSTPYCISYIDLKDPILIRSNGYFYNQSDWMQQGYWVWKNLGDQLPFDYEPD